MGFVEELGPSIAEQDEDQVALCKICFSEGNDDCPLLHEVCDCKGSLDAVHGRCLVKWQLKRTSKPWNCEICDSKIQWPANQTLQLVELLSELKTEETPPPPAPQPRSSRTQRQVVITSRVERRQSPGKWRLLQQAMSTRCLLAAQSLRTSIFLSGARQRGSSSSSSTVVD